LIGHPKLLGELVDSDLLRRHVSIQPFPIVIPSPLNDSVGVVFVVPKRGTNGFDIRTAERATPSTLELLAPDRLFEALRFDSIAVDRSTQPRSAPDARSVDPDVPRVDN
jgi:hypothetical protein